MNKEFMALVTEEVEENKFVKRIMKRAIEEIPDNHTLVRVHYSSLNYKDALSARGHKGITRHYPHTPGIDAAGIIEVTDSSSFNVGDEVIVTGYDLGMDTNGGFGEYIIVPDEWIVSKPRNLTLLESMIYGTAGFTAAICVYEIIKSDIERKSGKILVTGATGGVGSIATAILSKLGYDVVCSTGKKEQSEFLYKLGAQEIIDRKELEQSSSKPMTSAKWSAVVDNVGGVTLENAIKSVKMHGVICVLGNVSGDYFSSSVYPFLLRGIKLIGIDSASKDMTLRKYLWEQLSDNWKIDILNDIYKEVKLSELSHEIDKILSGEQVGRVVLKHNF
ncbi:YhdH/YhfP family quinone oxidoreductase [Candidatus Kapaibacterium sp.]